MNDLWDKLPAQARDDRLGLLYQSTRTNMVAVNTAVGQTERVNIPEIAQQGGTWGPMMCSNSIDAVGKYAIEQKQLYTYKKLVNILPLAMVDDLLSVTKCGMDSIEMNISINSLIELKKLTFHTPEENKKSKCHMMHIGNSSKVCPDMKVNGHTVERVSQAVYLSDVISSDGSNTLNIRDRVSKGMGQVNTVMNLLCTVSFGVSYFEIAVALREAHLINGMLSSAEVLYGIKKKEIEELEEIDKILIRKILDAPISSCVESLYLELGVIPIHILLKARRINYFHYLVNLDPEEMLYKFFETQYNYPTKDDWTLQLIEDLDDFGMPGTFEYLKSKSANAFKRQVKIKTKEYALNYLLGLKMKHSKMDNLVYNKLKLQSHLKSPDIPVHEAKKLFRFRNRTATFKENFGEKYTNKACPLCSVHMDTQTHAVQCVQVNQMISVEGNYRNIFKERIPCDISRTLYKITKLREDFI